MMSRKSFAKETTSDKVETTTQPLAEEKLINFILGNIRSTPDNDAESDEAEASRAQRKKKTILQDIYQTIDYLSKLGIKTPKDFAKTLSEAREEHYSQNHDVVPLGTIDAIVKACGLWKPFIAPESFDNLVCEQVKSMYHIHACAICYTNSGPELNAYIGHFAKLEKAPPLGASCSVNYYGKIAADGV